MSAGYRVRLVEEAVADLACEMAAEAVKVGAQRLQLLAGVSRCFLCCIVRGTLTSSVLLGRGGSSTILPIFCLRLSLLAARPGRPSAAPAWAGDRLVVGVAPRALELAGMPDRFCELLLAACWEMMDDDEFLGRAVASGEGARVWFMAPAMRGQGKQRQEQRKEAEKKPLLASGACAPTSR